MHKVTSGSDSSTGNVYKLFKEQIMLVLYKMFQRIKNEGMFSTSFYYANITLTPKPFKDKMRKESFRPILL